MPKLYVFRGLPVYLSVFEYYDATVKSHIGRFLEKLKG